MKTVKLGTDVILKTGKTILGFLNPLCPALTASVTDTEPNYGCSLQGSFSFSQWEKKKATKKILTQETHEAQR